MNKKTILLFLSVVTTVPFALMPAYAAGLTYTVNLTNNTAKKIDFKVRTSYMKCLKSVEPMSGTIEPNKKIAMVLRGRASVYCSAADDRFWFQVNVDIGSGAISFIGKPSARAHLGSHHHIECCLLDAPTQKSLQYANCDYTSRCNGKNGKANSSSMTVTLENISS